MEDPKSFEQIRQEVEESQKATIWPDTLRNGIRVDAFLWNGDRNAKLIQRAGLVVFGLTFLLIAACGFITFFEATSDDKEIPIVLMALVLVLISIRLFRNAFLRPTKVEEHDDEEDNPGETSA
jgi:hypothetical protein